MTDPGLTAQAISHPAGDTPTSYAREAPGIHPPLDFPDYRSTALRHPKQPLIYLPQNITELTGPALGSLAPVGELDNDLTRQHEGEPIGERAIVFGRVLDTEGKPLRNTSPVSYTHLWVTRRWAKARPSSEKWMCAGRHAL